MPMPQHCIDCDKVAVVLDDTTPYCPQCYMKEQNEKSKRNLKGAQLATAVGEAYSDGYIDGLSEQASQIAKAERLLEWILDTPITERVDFIIDDNIKAYFRSKK